MHKFSYITILLHMISRSVFFFSFLLFQFQCPPQQLLSLQHNNLRKRFLFVSPSLNSLMLTSRKKILTTSDHDYPNSNRFTPVPSTIESTLSTLAAIHTDQQVILKDVLVQTNTITALLTSPPDHSTPLKPLSTEANAIIILLFFRAVST